MRTETKMGEMILEIRARRKMAAPGVWAIEAEAKLADPDGTETFVNVSEYDDMTHYTVSSTSLYDESYEADDGEEDDAEFLQWVKDHSYGGKLEDVPIDDADTSEPAYIEQYTKLKDAIESKYWNVFDKLRQIVCDMIS